MTAPEFAEDDAAWLKFVLRLNLRDPAAARSLLRQKLSDAQVDAIDAEISRRLQDHSANRGE